MGCSDRREEVLEHLIQESENSADTPDTNEEFSDTDELLADIDEDLAETIAVGHDGNELPGVDLDIVLTQLILQLLHVDLYPLDLSEFS